MKKCNNQFEPEPQAEKNQPSKNDTENEESRIPFKQALAELPPSLHQRCAKQFLGAFIVTLIAMICILYFKSWYYAIGFIFAAYIAWIGISIVLRSRKGEIICKQMVCIKARKFPPWAKDRLLVAMREADANPGDEKSIHEYYIPASAKAAALLSENTLVNVYYDTKTPSELLAWQVTGLAI